MPIYNGNYYAPVWLNNEPPAINQAELRAMSGTLQNAQILTGSGAPTQYTEGVVGQLYVDEDTGEIYQCVSVGSGTYTWIDKADNAAQPYDPTDTYAEGAYCTYEGLLYKSNTEIDPPEASWNSAHWDRVYLADELEDKLNISDIDDALSSSSENPVQNKVVTTEKADIIIASASGNITSFPDGGSYPVEALTVGIEPVQSGTGDPSPDNVRPISGWSAVNAYATGKNMYNESTDTPDYYIAENGTITADNTMQYSNLISVVSGVQYTFSFICADGTTTARVHGYDESGTWVQQLGDKTASLVGGSYSISFTIPTGVSYLRISRSKTRVTYAQLELGSTATAYTSYQGTTYPITIPTPPGTVYGGYISVGADGSAELVVTMVSAVMASLNWTYQSSEVYFAANPVGMLSAASINMLCESYKPMGRGSAATLSNAASGIFSIYISMTKKSPWEGSFINLKHL